MWSSFLNLNRRFVICNLGTEMSIKTAPLYASDGGGGGGAGADGGGGGGAASSGGGGGGAVES